MAVSQKRLGGKCFCLELSACRENTFKDSITARLEMVCSSLAATADITPCLEIP